MTYLAVCLMDSKHTGVLVKIFTTQWFVQGTVCSWNSLCPVLGGSTEEPIQSSGGEKWGVCSSSLQ